MFYNLNNSSLIAIFELSYVINIPIHIPYRMDLQKRIC